MGCLSLRKPIRKFEDYLFFSKGNPRIDDSGKLAEDRATFMICITAKSFMGEIQILLQTNTIEKLEHRAFV